MRRTRYDDFDRPIDSTCRECGARYCPEEPECPECGMGHTHDTLYQSRVHVARKTHNAGTDREIRPGDTYRRSVWGGYYEEGPRWMTIRKTRLEKGPAWAE